MGLGAGLSRKRVQACFLFCHAFCPSPAYTKAMIPVNSSLSATLQRALRAIELATEGMTEEQMNWHPPEKWSSTLILEHLHLAYSTTAQRIGKLLESGRPEVRKRTFRDRAGGFLVLKMGWIPGGRKAPERIVPRGMSSAEAASAIRGSLAEIDRAISECEQRFGSSRRVLDHAILGPLSAADWRTFHCVHTLHHMKQIRRLREQMNSAGKG